MNDTAICKAMDEAKRFLEAARLAVTAIRAKDGRYQLQERAAARRASLDLTRALAAMRKTYS